VMDHIIADSGCWTSYSYHWTCSLVWSTYGQLPCAEILHIGTMDYGAFS